jgi:hypothetical protein
MHNILPVSALWKKWEICCRSFNPKYYKHGKLNKQYLTLNFYKTRFHYHTPSYLDS